MLDHLHVVDLTDLRAAMAGRLLADLGADVIKVEPPGGDPGRLRPPFAGNVAAPDRSLAFLYRNANKRGAVVDLHTDAGRRRLAALCDAADVLVENLGPAGQRAHDLTPGAVRERHRHLVHVAIADFGLDGPRAGWCAEPLTAFAVSGALHQSGFADRPPCWLPGYAAYDAASAFGAAGALAAILARARSGRGQTVEVSVEEAGLNALNPWSIPVADYARLYPMLPIAAPRNADGAYIVLRTATGFVRVLAGTVRQWRAFLALLGEPEALTAPEWESPLWRLGNSDVIRIIAGEALAGRTRDDVLAHGWRVGVPITPVNSPDEFVAAEQTRVRGYFRMTGFPHVGDAPFAPSPFNFSRTPSVLARPAPAPGADDGDFPPREPEPPAVPASDEAPILADLRVIDLGVGAVGPEIAGLLGDLGAEVIKIESRANLDFLRGVTIEPDAPNRAWTFNDECRGQKSVCLDLRTDEGRALARQLCAAADVVVENNRGGVVQAWGLDYDDVRRLRPDVIYVASQGYGRGGPLGEIQAFGPLNSSFAGANALWNHADAPYPAGSALNHPDHMASKLGAVAVLAALEHRRRTGEGQRIEMAQTEAAAYLLGEFYLQGPTTGRPAAAQGNAADYAAPHGVYPAAGDDRWVAIAVVGDDAWARFARALRWPVEPALATLDARLAARAALDARIAEFTRARSAEETVGILQAAGVAAAVVANALDHRADVHLAARRALVTVEHPEIGSEMHSACPIRLGRTRLAPPAPAPLLGADTEDVLTRVLGLSRAEVARLVECGVCR